MIPAAIRVSANLSVLSPSLTSFGGKDPKTSHSKSTTRAGAWLRGNPSAKANLTSYLRAVALVGRVFNFII